MMDTFMNILQWLIPAGGLGTVVVWLFSKTLREVRTTKEISDTYKTMYEGTSEILTSVQDEITELHKELGRFRRAIAKAFGCQYFDNCPVQHELQRQEGQFKAKPKAKHRNRQSKPDDDQLSDDTGFVSIDGDSAEEPLP
jgi:hypothetical protein